MLTIQHLRIIEQAVREEASGRLGKAALLRYVQLAFSRQGRLSVRSHSFLLRSPERSGERSDDRTRPEVAYLDMLSTNPEKQEPLGVKPYRDAGWRSYAARKIKES